MTPTRPHQSAVRAIFEYVEQIEGMLTAAMLKKVQSLLRDKTNTHADVATHLIEMLGLEETSRPSVERLITNLVPRLLTDEERAERKLHAQRRNAVAAHAAEYDRVGTGRIGGEIRARQYMETGQNAAGHNIWLDAELEDLRELLADESNYHRGGAHIGKPDYGLLEDLYNALPHANRTKNAIRLMTRRLLNGERNGGE